MGILRERVEAVGGRVPPSPAWAGGDEGVDAEDVDVDNDRERQIDVRAPRRVFPELITEAAEPGEKQVYGAGA